MDKTYSRINWQNEPSTATPINEVNLNRMDYSINEIDDRVVQLDNTKAKQSDLLLSIKDVTYNTNTGVFVFTWQNGTSLQVDLNIEKIPVSFSMSPEGIIKMVTTDGTEYTCDVAALIKTYIFEDSNQIDFTETTQEGGSTRVTAIIKQGSITEDLLDPTVLAGIASAKTYAQQAGQKATEAQSWAIGGTGTRAGEDTDNAKYYAQQAQGASFQQSNWNETNPTQSAFIINKPFQTIGNGLSVDEQGNLNATAQPISSLSDIGDVEITEPENKQGLIYKDGKWVNEDIEGGGGDANVWSGTHEEFEQIKSTLKDGTIVNFTDDYDANICQRVEDCLANTNPNNVAGANVIKEVQAEIDEVSGNLAQLIVTEVFAYSKSMSASANTRADRYVINVAKDGYNPISAIVSEADNSDIFNYIVDIGDSTDKGNRNKVCLRVYSVKNTSTTNAKCNILVTYAKNI